MTNPTQASRPVNCDAKEAKIKAIDLLARREHSRGELRQKLVKKQFDLDIIERLLDELVELDYLSDERYASMVIRSGYERGHGPMKIKQKLQQSGVDSQVISSSFEYFEEDWFALAKDVRLRKFKEGLCSELEKKDKQAYFKEKARQMRFLAGRGFSMDQIDYALLDQ